jgi:DNA polymerase alpha subunit A
MATHKLSASNVQDALAQMEASSGGVKRTEQYVVKEHVPVIETVSEEEYREIIKKRREADFVVGKDKLGYDDNGCELWEDKAALAQHKRELEEIKREAAAKAKAAGKASDSPAKGAGEALLLAFNAGAQGAAESVSVPTMGKAAQKDLDDMLQRMCGEIEADPSAPGAQPDTQGARSQAKRRNDNSAENSRAQKKQAKAKAAPKEKKEPMQAEGIPVVKSEPTASDNTSIKEEVASNAPQRTIKIEGGSAVKKEESAGEKMQQWLQSDVKVETETSEAPALPSGVQMKPNLANDGSLWFFFVDAFEDDRASPPRVYLFGKVLVGNEYQSCCLVVESLERCVHLLLNVDDLDDEAAVQKAAVEAEAEADKICPGMRKLRVALKWRNYAFEKALPQGAGYLPFLKLVCDASGPSFPSATGKSFNAVFGAQSSLLERLLLTKRIMGPSWLRLQPGSFNPSQFRLSFSAVELRISPQSITVPKSEADLALLNEGCPKSSPPLRMMTLSMQTMQASVQQSHEPLVVACTFHPKFSPDASDSEAHLRQGMRQWQGVRRYDGRALPRDSERILPQKNVEHFQSEQNLLTSLLQKIQDFDPDVLASHNSYGFDLDVLSSRIAYHRLNTWQKLGRLRRPKDRQPRIDGRQSGGFWAGTNMTCGRLVCDLSLQVKDLLPKLAHYELSNVARHQLGVDGLVDIEPENLPRYYDSADALVNLAQKTLDNAGCIGRLVHSLQILPLSKQLTNLAGNMWKMSLQNKRAERNEMLLCHEFHRAKFVLPDRENAFAKKRRLQTDSVANDFDMAEEGGDPTTGSGARRQKAAYSGGLVLEPKVGLYDEFVMLLDFNSLYPSVIQEYNICFTTVERPDESQVVKCSSEAELLAQTSLPDGTIEDGILPKVLRRLVSSRQQVKAAMKSERNPKTLQTLEIRQKALKLTANSMYGCLGFQHSRFYAKPLAAIITAKGREALQSTITVVTCELSLDVVYGDTDSVFVNTKTTDYNDAMQAAQQIKRAVNKKYKKLEIEIDGVFGRLLLLKKKKYAGLKVINQEKGIYEREYKGLDIVRRDWCGLAKSMGEAILDQVLTCQGKEEAVNWIHAFLTEKCAEIDGGKVPLEQYVITKGLTKNPEDYPDAKNQAHVQVALRMKARGKAVRSGQEVEYIVCGIDSDGPKATLASRARHLSEFPLDSTLRPDSAWYKSQQVHPLVSRLLGPVEGTDASRVAECLGLDGARFAQSAAAKGQAADDAAGAYESTWVTDVDALLDRKTRFKGFKSQLPGVACNKCGQVASWRQLLQPEVGAATATGTNALFRCGNCGAEVEPAQAQNVLTLQLRSLLRSHSEGWVQSTEEVDHAKTRRQKFGQNLTSERHVLQELEFLENICEGASKGYAGEDLRGCRRAATSIMKHAKMLLSVNGYNWLDCGKIFTGIFGPM